MADTKKQILLTNDDGIQSPGLWAAAEALSSLGYVTVAAPREQESGTGRSFPIISDGKIQPTQMVVHDQEWTVYAIGGTPAQTVQHSLLEIMPVRPDLVVSGINYGENIGTIVGVSGTVGAALEATSMGIPAMAVSFEVKDTATHHTHSLEVNFSTAAFFTHYFAKIMLQKELPDDVDMLKIDIPLNATPQTSWRTTRMARHRYYAPIIKRNGSWNDKGRIGGYRMKVKPDEVPPDTDVYAFSFDHLVSVTPLSLDMTSRVDLQKLETLMRHESK